MDWDTALKAFMKDRWDKLGPREFEAMYDYPWYGFSIGGLWSYRGKIWKKYAGQMPTPEEVGLEADHAFFEPDYVCYSETKKFDGTVVNQEWHHHGVKMRPSHRLWKTRPCQKGLSKPSRSRPT